MATMLSASAGSGDGTKPTAGDSATGSGGFDANSQGILDTILQQLLAGGTPQMQQQAGARQAEVAGLQGQRAGYSKEAAFADAQGLIAQTMRQALEKLVPSINSAALGAGASQSSMRALLTQRAAENAAQMSATEGVKAATSYGQVAGGLSDVIARLLSVQDPSAELLIRALGTAKGPTSGGTTASRGSSGGSNGNGTNFSGPSLFGGGSQTPSAPMAPMVFGGGGKDYSGQNRTFGPVPDTNPENIVGTTLDTLRELAGDTTFRGYQF